MDTSLEEIERTMRVNTLAGMIGVAKVADYSASKFAHFGFDESLRSELKQMKSKINTTIVTPFFINTGMFDGIKLRFSFLLPILMKKKLLEK